MNEDRHTRLYEKNDVVQRTTPLFRKTKFNSSINLDVKDVLEISKLKITIGNAM